jgi:lipopolysaccharide transport system permease protein
VTAKDVGSAVSPSAPPSVVVPIVDIEARSGLASLDLRPNLRALWQFRGLVFFLVWRDLKVRYKQTVLGGSWAIIQPVTTMIIFTVVFSRLAGLPSEGVPYPAFAYAAILPWTFFAGALAQIGNSLVTERNLITKVYFPRLVVPVAAGLVGLVDLAVAFVVLVGLLLYFGITPSLAALWLPMLVLLALGSALGIGLWLAALNVLYRDFRYVIPFLVQVWMFVSPVVYPSSLVPPEYRALYSLNPMVAVIDGFRWALLGTPHPGVGLWTALVVVPALLVSGALYFQHMERRIADAL